MVSPHRDSDKKLIDGGDFTNVVQHNRSRIDGRKLRRLAERVHAGAGIEIAGMIEDIDAGRTIQL